MRRSSSTPRRCPDPAQQLRFLVWRFYRDPVGHEPGAVCIEEGIAYPDALPEDKPGRLAAAPTLRRSKAGTGGGRLPADASSSSRCPGGWKSGCTATATTTATAAPWSASTSSSTSAGSRRLLGAGRGRLSRWLLARLLGLPTTPTTSGATASTGRRIRARALDPRRTLFAWAAPRARTTRIHSVAAAASSTCAPSPSRSPTAPTPSKAPAPPSATPTRSARSTTRVLSTSCSTTRSTTSATPACSTATASPSSRATRACELEPHRLYSPATVGTQLPRGLRPTPPAGQVHVAHRGGARLGPTPSDPQHHPGGRAPRRPRPGAARLRDERLLRRPSRSTNRPHPSSPSSFVDFTSMYPSVNALLGTWPLLCAEQARRPRCDSEDATPARRSGPARALPHAQISGARSG